VLAVMLCNDSVMENLPPVILTDEDICLEIVEKGKCILLLAKTDAGFKQIY